MELLRVRLVAPDSRAKGKPPLGEEAGEGKVKKLHSTSVVPPCHVGNIELLDHNAVPMSMI